MEPDEIRALLGEILTAVGPEPPIRIEIDVDGNALVLGDMDASQDWHERLHQEFKKKDWSWLIPPMEENNER